MAKNTNSNSKTEGNMTDTIDIAQLKDMKISALNKIAKDLDINGLSGLKKQELIFKILQAKAEKEGLMFGSGVLEVLPEVSVPSFSQLQLSSFAG
jgi:transcription termination factor Rho